MTATASTCAGCPAPIVQPPRGGRRRKWCSDRCRKRTLYSGECVDCGKPTSGDRPDGISVRCLRCHNVKNGISRKVWTREAIIAAIQLWARKYGDPPSLADWNVSQVRDVLRDEKRVARYERESRAGACPGFTTVIHEFGSWNAAIAESGFEPRPPHGGGGNASRRRNLKGAA